MRSSALRPNGCPKKGSTFVARPPVEQMNICSSLGFRRLPPGKPTEFFAGFRRLVRQVVMRLEIDCRVKARGVHFPCSLLRRGVGTNSSSPFRLPLREWLRPSLHLSFREQVGARGRFRAPQRRLRAWRFADIPTPLPIQNTTEEVFVMFSFFSTSLALDACAITSALAPQRFPITSATEIAPVPATPTPQPITGSALASQRLVVNHPLPWGPA